MAQKRTQAQELELQARVNAHAKEAQAEQARVNDWVKDNQESQGEINAQARFEQQSQSSKLDIIEHKLSGFEQKFEQVATAIVKLTLIEERTAVAIESNREIKRTIKDNDTRIQNIERKQERSTIYERVVWVIVVIAITGYFAGKVFTG